MSGHSKWNNIKNRKGAQDQARAKTFHDLSKQIRLAVKQGGSGDPKSNASLRLLVDKARQANMPNDKVQRAINAGLGKSASGATIQEMVYEAFGPGGVGMLVVAYTENANRTGGEVRNIFSRNKGALAGPGSAMYLFTREQMGYRPTMPMEITDPETVATLEILVEELHVNEDVEEIFLAATWTSPAGES